MTDKDLLNQISIASPCPAKWDEMAGDDRARFCGQCQKHVYNLSTMTTADAAALIREKEGKLCARIYRRRDGTMLTADCPVGVQRFRERCVTAIAAAITLVLSTFGLTGCAASTMGGIRRPTPINPPMVEPTSGVLVVPNQKP